MTSCVLMMLKPPLKHRIYVLVARCIPDLCGQNEMPGDKVIIYFLNSFSMFWSYLDEIIVWLDPPYPNIWSINCVVHVCNTLKSYNMYWSSIFVRNENPIHLVCGIACIYIPREKRLVTWGCLSDSLSWTWNIPVGLYKKDVTPVR